MLKNAIVPLFILVALGLFLFKGGAPKDPAREALYACKEFILDEAHNPKSVEFEETNSEPKKLYKDVYSVGLSLRAENGFGALRKFNTECMVRYENGKFKLLEIREVE